VAGGWIKLENATIDKPEIILLAKSLGVSHADAVLSFLRLFIWADMNVADGVVRHLSALDVDTASRALPGTCEALASDCIGWLSIKADGVHFSNWDRHNGTNAKRRAQDAERKAKERASSEKCHAAKRTKLGPEKSREDKTSPTPKPPPDEWRVVVAKLKAFGLVLAEAAVNEADVKGFTPWQILDWLAWLTDPTRNGDYGPGTILERIRTPGSLEWSVDYGWPPPSKEAASARREESVTRHAENQRRQQAEQESKAKQLRIEIEAPLEAAHGKKLDSLSDDELNELVGDAPKLATPLKRFGRSSPLVRPELLSMLAARDGPPPVDRQSA
jgi:hypothetical protein